MPNLSPPSRAAISPAPDHGADAVRNRGQQGAANVAAKRFVDRLEAIEVEDQDGLGAFGRTVRIGQQLRQPFVEHQTVAELGEGVAALLRRPLAHVVGADQPTAIHRDRLDPERAAIGKGDLAIALAVVGPGIAIDAIEQFRVTEQFGEYQIGLKQLAVGPDDRNRPVHAHEGLERQAGRAFGSIGRIVAVPIFQRTDGASSSDRRGVGHDAASKRLLRCNSVNRLE